MSILGVFLAFLLIGVVVAITIVIMIFGTGKISWPSFSFGSYKTWLVEAGLLALSILIYFNWGVLRSIYESGLWFSFKDWFSTWLATSDGGQAMHLQKEVIEKWLWLGVITMFTVAAILVFKPAFLNNLLTLILLGFFIAMIFYVMTRNDVVQVAVAENGCLTVSQLNDATRKIDEKGRCINVKASDKPFTLTTNKNGYAIRMVFHKGELERQGLPDNSFSYAYVDTTTRALDGVQNFTPVKSQFTQSGVENINFRFFATEVK